MILDKALTIICLSCLLFKGSASLSDHAYKFLKSPDKLDGVVSTRYMITADNEIESELCDDMVKIKYIDEESMKEKIKQIQKDELNEDDSSYTYYKRRPNKHDHREHSHSICHKCKVFLHKGRDWLYKGVKYVKGLFGGDTSTKNLRSSEPTPDEVEIMDDIEKYVDGVVESSSGTFDKILKYIVAYVRRNVHFWLFSRDTNGYETLSLGRNSNVSESGFNPSKKTIVLVHGWNNGGDSFYPQTMITGYEKFGDYNIISVDWSELSYSFYTISRLSVNFVGPFVAQMIDFMATHHKLDVDEVHLLGHSLGAHIAGIAGMLVKTGKVGRVTGFDPASPLFGDNNKYRLDASDAKFVDVIHTSFLGMSDPLGHADFYPNGGGPSQPGCGIDVAVCPHRRSFEYYITSMTDNKFFAYFCNSWDSFVAGNCTTNFVHMGVFAPERRKGKFYLKTSGEPPYALGDKTLESLTSKIKSRRFPRQNQELI